MNLPSKRLDSLDIAKGLGILLVVLGHAISALNNTTPWVVFLNYVIYLVHMPLFFVVAGYLFERYLSSYERRGLKSFVMKKATLFLVPYVFFSFLMYFVILAGTRFAATRGLIGDVSVRSLVPLEFLKSVITYVAPLDAHLWFSYVMFLVLIISYIIRKTDVAKLLPFLYLLYVCTWFITFPELVWKVFRYLLLFSVGRLVMKYSQGGEQIFSSPKILLGSSGVFFLATILYYYTKEIASPFGGVIKPLAEVSGVYLLVYLSSLIDRSHHGVKKCIVHLGRESYFVYLLSQPYIVPVIVKVGLKLEAPQALVVVLACVAGTFVPIAINRLFVSRSRVLKFLCLGQTK